MKTIWVINERNDYYAENNIYLYENKDNAMNTFKEIIENNKDETEFNYIDGRREATWEYKGYYCSVRIWEQALDD